VKSIDLSLPNSITEPIELYSDPGLSDWASKVVFNPPWARMVFSVYAMDADAMAAMQERISRSYIRTYQRTLRNEMQKLGCRGRVKLTDATQLKMLDDEARKWAQSITNTYNQNLAGQITKVIDGYRQDHKGSLRGINRYVLSKRLRPWTRNYWRGRRRKGGGWVMGKLKSVAVTEETRAHLFALREFYKRTPIEGIKGRVSPRMAVCDRCADLVRLGWMDIKELMSQVILPQHPNCPHEIQTKRDRRRKVDCSKAWKGG